MSHPVRLLTGLAAFSILGASGLTAPFERDSNFQPAGHSLDPVLGKMGTANPDPAGQLQPVKLKFTVNECGVPTKVEVVSGSGDREVDRRCVRALQERRFTPRTAGGVAVASEETMVMIPQLRR